jgi:hypothetical protein
MRMLCASFERVTAVSDPNLRVEFLNALFFNSASRLDGFICMLIEPLRPPIWIPRLTALPRPFPALPPPGAFNDLAEPRPFGMSISLP